jgi:hypothetical protein
MMGMPHSARIWLACGATDMRRGFDGLAALVQTQLSADPYTGHLLKSTVEPPHGLTASSKRRRKRPQ